MKRIFVLMMTAVVAAAVTAGPVLAADTGDTAWEEQADEDTGDIEEEIPGYIPDAPAEESLEAVPYAEEVEDEETEDIETGTTEEMPVEDMPAGTGEEMGDIEEAVGEEYTEEDIDDLDASAQTDMAALKKYVFDRTYALDSYIDLAGYKVSYEDLEKIKREAANREPALMYYIYSIEYRYETADGKRVKVPTGLRNSGLTDETRSLIYALRQPCAKPSWMPKDRNRNLPKPAKRSAK